MALRLCHLAFPFFPLLISFSIILWFTLLFSLLCHLALPPSLSSSLLCFSFSLLFCYHSPSFFKILFLLCPFLIHHHFFLLSTPLLPSLPPSLPLDLHPEQFLQLVLGQNRLRLPLLPHAICLHFMRQSCPLRPLLLTPHKIG